MIDPSPWFPFSVTSGHWASPGLAFLGKRVSHHEQEAGMVISPRPRDSGSRETINPYKGLPSACRQRALRGGGPPMLHSNPKPSSMPPRSKAKRAGFSSGLPSDHAGRATVIKDEPLRARPQVCATLPHGVAEAVALRTFRSSKMAKTSRARFQP
jgi:hypothetical protein